GDGEGLRGGLRAAEEEVVDRLLRDLGTGPVVGDQDLLALRGVEERQLGEARFGVRGDPAQQPREASEEAPGGRRVEEVAGRVEAGREAALRQGGEEEGEVE